MLLAGPAGAALGSREKKFDGAHDFSCAAPPLRVTSAHHMGRVTVSRSRAGPVCDSKEGEATVAPPSFVFGAIVRRSSNWMEGSGVRLRSSLWLL